VWICRLRRLAPLLPLSIHMGIRRSSTKHKKSKVTTSRNTVQRETVKRRSARATEKEPGGRSGR